MEDTARELLRALRGPHSQTALSRRLGFRSNVCADWEQGQRSPSMEVFFQVCAQRTDVPTAIHAFHPPAAAAFRSGPDRWLRSLRGSTPVQEVADRVGASRYAVGRWLSGRTQPRLPDLLRLIDALTGRVQDFVAAFVDIESVPSLLPRVRRAEASRGLGVEQPWTLAVMLAIEAGVEEAALAEVLHRPRDEVRDCVAALEGAGVIRRTDAGLVPGEPLTIDTQRYPNAGRTLKRFWGQVGVDRIDQPREDDLLSFNLFACSRADALRIRALQRQFYREVRSIVAASDRSEVVALLNAQLVTWS